MTLIKNIEACELENGRVICEVQDAYLYNYMATPHLFLVDDDFRNCKNLPEQPLVQRSTIIFTSTGGILTEDTIIGTGLTIPKAYQLSIDLKIQPNPSTQWNNVFQFRVRVPKKEFTSRIELC